MSCPGSIGVWFFAAGGALRADGEALVFRAEDDDECQQLLKRRLLLLPCRWLKRGGLCRKFPLLLRAQMAAKFLRASGKKSGQANV